ncbi:nudC domain-containing protein 1-like [Ornithodoros turicata]|uniref:NudC domain-containing protein 1 n=1 Tax=Ornithodoros turicata TaxID=34597 RepID=A0A2R5LJZ1_9ACAR
MTVKIDLQPNRGLLDAKFECYRLTLEPLPVLKKSLKNNIQKVHLQDDQYGYLHVQMTGLLNALIQDPWDFNTVFCITESHHVIWVHLSQDNQLTEPRMVWQVPEPKGVQYTCTLSLPHAEWCLLSDGTGIVYILSSPSRPQGEPWQLCHTYCPEWSQPSAVLITSAHCSFPSNQQIECLMGYISRPQDVQGNVTISETTVHFVCVLEWLTFSCALVADCSSWSLKRVRRLMGASVPVYSAFDTLGSSLCLASEKEFSFIFDSCKPEIGHEVEDAATKAKEPPLYSFIQAGETVTVVFKLPESVTKKDVKVELSATTIEICVNEKTVLKGDFPHAVIKHDSTWTILDQKLEVHLTKAEAGTVWKEVVKGDTRGEEVFDPAFVEEIHTRLAHLTSDAEAKELEKPAYNYQELDECDDTTEYFSFTRLCGDSHRATHQVNLSGHQWLFKVQTSPDSLPALCLRHDVDGLVWQPKDVASDGDADPFRVEHVATFNAFGYVQASKQDRKYELGSPDFSFAAICDSVRHLYLYRQPESLSKSLELRNRKTGKEVSTIAKQHVISLEQCDAILGMVTSPQCIFVLSSNTIYAVRVSSS